MARESRLSSVSGVGRSVELRSVQYSTVQFSSVQYSSVLGADARGASRSRDGTMLKITICRRPLLGDSAPDADLARSRGSRANRGERNVGSTVAIVLATDTARVPGSGETPSKGAEPAKRSQAKAGGATHHRRRTSTACRPTRPASRRPDRRSKSATLGRSSTSRYRSVVSSPGAMTRHVTRPNRTEPNRTHDRESAQEGKCYP